MGIYLKDIKPELLLSDFMMWRSSFNFCSSLKTFVPLINQCRESNQCSFLLSNPGLGLIGNFLIKSRIVWTRLISQINLTNLKDIKPELLLSDFYDVAEFL